MSQADDINSIVKVKKIKSPLPTLPVQTGIKSKKGVGLKEPEIGTGLMPPLTLEILTYDNTADVLIQANNGDFTIKTVATAIIKDAYDNEYPIDEIIYATP